MSAPPPTTFESAFRSAPRPRVNPQADDHSVVPRFVTMGLRLKTAAAAPERIATVLLAGPNDQTSDAFTTSDSINNTQIHNKNKNSGAPLIVSPPNSMIPLMPAMIGATEVCNSAVWSSDPDFMMFCYKVTPCTHRTPHDWRVCPWAHPNERAARRCPRQYAYSSVPCVNARSGRSCAKGHACEFSHNVTEYWLHPTRYRAEWCSLGLRCNRRLCFFAHSDAELRLPSDAPSTVPATPLVQLADLVRTPAPQQQHHHALQASAVVTGNSSSGSAPILTDNTQHLGILQALMSTAAGNASIAESQPPSMAQQQQQQQQHQVQPQQHQFQPPLPSAVTAFCDLLGPGAQTASTSLQPLPAMQQGMSFVPAETLPLPNSVNDTTAQLIAALMQSLPRS